MSIDRKRTVVITGGNRGIGLALTEEYARRGYQVIATCRTEKKAIIAAGGIPLELHLDDLAQIELFSIRLQKQIDSIDIFIHNAATSQYHQDVLPEQKNIQLGTLEASGLEKMIRINAMFPLLLSQKLLPLFKDSSQPKIIFISSRKSSLQMVEEMGGGNYGYRGSKILLNMWAKLFAKDVEADGICVNMIHPGWVRTQMGGASAPLSPEESAEKLAQLIDTLTIERTGQFLRLDGTQHPY